MTNVVSFPGLGLEFTLNRIAVEIRSSQIQYDLITTNRADLEKRVKGDN